MGVSLPATGGSQAGPGGKEHHLTISPRRYDLLIPRLGLWPASPDLPHEAGAHLEAGEAELLHLRDRQPRAGPVVDTHQVWGKQNMKSETHDFN